MLNKKQPKPADQVQYNTDGATGFQEGTHSHKYEAAPTPTFTGGLHLHFNSINTDTTPVAIMFSGNSPKSEKLAIWLKHLFVSTGQRVSSWQISNNEINETSHYFRAATDQLVLAVPNLDNQLAKNDFQDAIADAARRQCKIVQIVPAGNENLTVDHRYPVIIISETAESAVIDLVSGLTKYGCIIRTPREDDSTRLMVDAETVLPRLKRVSNRALQDAATVGEKRFESERQSATDTALYVKRDLENAIIEKLATTSCILVSGPAGAGKTGSSQSRV